MQQIKICPECSTEYFSHIETCADCGVSLLWPEENKRAQEEKEQLKEKAVDDAVAIREGDLKWMNELYAVLIDSGIPCAVYADPGCKKGCCGDTCRLLVSSQDVERAHERIEAYFGEVHPEVRASNDLVDQGKCPACGSPVGSGAIACPDCGLTLLIVEEE